MKGLLWKGTVTHNSYSGTNSKNLWGMPLSYPEAFELSVELRRSSHRWCSKTKAVLNIFAKFTHLSQSLVFNKVAGIRSATLSKQSLWYIQVFSCEFCKTFKNTYFEEHQWTTAGLRATEIEPQRFASFALSCLL